MKSKNIQCALLSVLLMVSCVARVGTMIALVNGKVTYVSGYGNLTPLKTIVLTLRAK